MHKLNHTYSIVCLCKVIGFVQRYNGCDSFCIHAIGCTNIMASVEVDERVRAWAQTNGWVRMEEGVVTHIHYERCVFQMNLSKRVPFVTSASVNLTLKTYSKPSKFDLYGKTVEKLQVRIEKPLKNKMIANSVKRKNVSVSTIEWSCIWTLNKRLYMTFILTWKIRLKFKLKP